MPAVPLRTAPLILTDFTSEPYSAPGLTSVAAALRASCDAVLVGEHENRPGLPARPARVAAARGGGAAMDDAGLPGPEPDRPGAGTAGLRHLGVDAVLCVTGDARAYDVRPDVTQVFDLDGPRLAALAAAIGLPAAVPETPGSPPRHQRAFRLVQKQRAGRRGRGPQSRRAGTVAAFMAAAARAGVTIPVIAAVAVFTDAPSAAVLSGLPGLELDPRAVRAVLDAPDPVAAGITAAAREAQALLVSRASRA